MKVIKKSVGKPMEIVETNEKYLMDCGRSFLGHDITIERVYLEGYEFIMLVDEDGLMKQLPLNFFMEFTGNPHFPIQAIVGDVYFVRNKKLPPNAGEIWDWEVDNVTDKDVAFVERVLKRNFEIQLAMIMGRDRK